MNIKQIECTFFECIKKQTMKSKRINNDPNKEIRKQHNDIKTKLMKQINFKW